MRRPPRSGKGEGTDGVVRAAGQRSNRIGLGLAFSRWGVAAHGGRLYARNMPGEGCVFTMDLPRSIVPTVAPV